MTSAHTVGDIHFGAVFYLGSEINLQLGYEGAEKLFEISYAGGGASALNVHLFLSYILWLYLFIFNHHVPILGQICQSSSRSFIKDIKYTYIYRYIIQD